LARLRLATRGSPLARWQAEKAAACLRGMDPALEIELVLVRTLGDKRLDLPVWELGGQGVFVKEVQSALRQRAADVAVHSAKDLPSQPSEGLLLAALLERADARDALVGASLAGLAPGASVATGSLRRRAQLAWLRPDLSFVSLRGNIATRLDKVPHGGAVVVAYAALERLGLAERAAQVLDVSLMLPQVGQGAIALEVRAEVAGSGLGELVAAVDHADTHSAVAAERAFLRRLGSGCDLPVGAHARPSPSDPNDLELEGLLARPDGRILVRKNLCGPKADSESLGQSLAEGMLGLGGETLQGWREAEG